jgi:hypothetical protein
MTDAAQGEPEAKFLLKDADGNIIGEETFTQKRDRLLINWQNLDGSLGQIKATEGEARKEVYSFLFGADAKVGTNTYDLGGGWKVKAVRKINYKLEQDLFKITDAKERIAKCGNIGPELSENLIKVKYELSETNYKKLVEDAKSYPEAANALAIINELVTSSDGMPGFEIVPPKDKS